MSSPCHSALEEHTHSGFNCPVVGKSNKWCPAQAGDSRSPCPALNTMANHGYIARDGKNLSPRDIALGLQACYNLSTLLAWFLAIGGFLILLTMRRLDLYTIGQHGRIEHNASLVHKDTPKGQLYAPIEVEEELVRLLLDDAKTGNEKEGLESGDSRTLMDATSVARSRVRRERQSPKLNFAHAEIARGEMAIILGVFEMQEGKNVGIPVEWMHEWIQHERLPKDWRPTHVQGLFDVVRRAKQIRVAMGRLRKTEM